MTTSQQPNTLLIDNILLLPDGPAGAAATAGAILVSDARIKAVLHDNNEIAALGSSTKTVLDGKGKLVIPGLINGHCHTYATVLRGTQNSQPLEVWALYTMAWGRSLDADLVATAVELSAAEMIRNGVTSVIDHIPHIGLFDHTLAAHARTGMRVGIAPFMQDIPDHKFLEFDLPDELRTPLETPAPMTPTQTSRFFENFFERLADMPDTIIGMIGPNAPQRCSEELWLVWQTLQEKYDAPVHTHLLETAIQAQSSQQKWQGGLVGEMERQGLLNDNLSVAHAIWLLESERELLARYGVTIIHNPASNLMLGSGALAYAECKNLSIPVGIGSDSANTAGRHDIFEGARLASMLPRLSEPDYNLWPQTADVLHGSREAGAKALGLSGQLGDLVPGQLADLVLLDMDNLQMLGPVINPELVAQHASRDVVCDVMINGHWVLREKELVHLDEKQIRTGFSEQRQEFLNRSSEAIKLAERTAPVVKRNLLD